MNQTPGRRPYILSPIVWLILDLYHNYVVWSYFVTPPGMLGEAQTTVTTPGMLGEAQTTATTSTTSVTMPKASSSPRTTSESIEEPMDNGFTRTHHETQDLDFDRSTFGGSFMVSFLV